MLLGHKVVIPLSLRKKFLNILHGTHLGMVKSKSLARSYVWWPNINYEIENLIKNCENCLAVRNSPSKVQLQTWEYPKKPWYRVHVDYAGPIFQKYYILIVVDAFSKWPEAIVTSNNSSSTTINALREIFARLGLPNILVSDNAKNFKSDSV